MAVTGLNIVVDSREKAPFAFTGSKIYEDTTVEVGSLQTGDYSLVGLWGMVAVERKSLADLVMCLGSERERFVRELERARGLEAFCVVVEGSWEELAKGEYRSQLNPHSACQSVMSFVSRLHVPFHFAGSRNAAEYCTWSFLHQFAQGKLNHLRAVEKCLKAGGVA